MSHDVPSGPIALDSSMPPPNEPAAPHHAEGRRPRPAFITEISNATDTPLVMPSETPRNRFAEFLAHLAHRAIRVPEAVWAAGDGIIAFGCVGIAHLITPFFLGPTYILDYSVRSMALTHAIILFLASYACGLYSRSTFTSTYRLLLLTFGSNLVAIVGTTLFQTWIRYVQVGRFIILYTFVLTWLSTLLIRMLAKGFAGQKKARVLLVGDPIKYQYFATGIATFYGGLYEPPAFLDVRPFAPNERVERTLEMFFLSRADEVVVEDDSEMLFDLLHASAPIIARGGVLRTISAFHEELFRETPIDIVDCRMLLGAGWGVGRQSTEVVKRSVDVLLATAGLLLALPICLVVALLVRLTSRGPVIYRQHRVGRFGAPFSIYKFRTMRVDAERDGARWASTNDARVTPIGNLLRKTRLDELPQLWNILSGQMSFVGPRPERPEFIAELEKEIPYYQLRHLVKPGLTGWAQICYPYGASVADAKRKLCYDLYYVRHYGLSFDLAICLKTAFAMMRGSR